MKPRKPKTIRNPFAYEKAQRAKQRRHEALIATIADRLSAIVRDKHGGEMRVYSLPQAWILMMEGGALKPNEGRHGGISRQALISEALQLAIASERVTLSHDSGTGDLQLSVPRVTPTISPEVRRKQAIERYEDSLPRISGRHYADLRRWGEVV